MIRWLKTVWYVLTLRCEEADRLRSLDENTTRAQRVGEVMHRTLCKSCRRAKKQTQILSRLLANLDESASGVRLDGAARARIASAIDAENNL